MEITVRRLWPKENVCAIGRMDVNGATLCYTLEDPIREIQGQPVAQWKVQNETAIPFGRYKVTIDWSGRFAKDMPHILDVTGFTGIRIHGGNRASDVAGCIAVGAVKVDDEMIASSPSVFTELFNLIEEAIASNEEVWITIT